MRSSRVRMRDAMDVSAQARLGARTNELGADGQAVWSRHPDAGVKLCETYRRAMVANEPGTPAFDSHISKTDASPMG